MVGSTNVYLATRGSRPGDGLADVLFGALFAVALRHIKRACADEGLTHHCAGALIGRPDEIVPVGWADDLAILADFPDPRSLQARAPRVIDITLTTLEHLKFRVNLGREKTEVMIDVRGPEAKRVRTELLSGNPVIPLPDTRDIRVSAEYRYLGVVQQPRDNGRRDQELALQRAQNAWAHARGLVSSASLPWALKHAWIAGRVLPAAYATLATSTATSGRATAPLAGFFEKATRALALSWQFGHVLSKPSLCLFAGLASPQVATVIARVRLALQMCKQGPLPVWEVFEAGWNRATTLCELLTDACNSVLPAIPSLRGHTCVTLPLLREHVGPFLSACQHLSRHGTAYQAFWELWTDVVTPRTKKVIGAPGVYTCPLCHQNFPSHQSLAAHTHRRHSVVNSLTLFTAGTTCLWCHTEHYSTDRLKYHLSRSPLCLHGLRVQVGHSYTYGSGTKRSGARGHRGLAPLRLPGPVNATPAQRHAASEGRLATTQELRQELLQATGVTDVYQWPEVAFTSPAHDNPSPLPAGSQPPPRPFVHPDLASSPLTYHFRRFSDAFAEGTADLPSPLWKGLARVPTCFGLPKAWHRWWPLWLAADSLPNPWSSQARRAQAPLRAGIGRTADQHCKFLLSLTAITVTFRQVCLLIQGSNALWMPGVPSSAGQALLRRMLPQASFHVVQTPIGRIFVVAASPIAAALSSSALLSEISASMSFSFGRALQPSPVYHVRPLGADS